MTLILFGTLPHSEFGFEELQPCWCQSEVVFYN